jgi:hypothetical protein
MQGKAFAVQIGGMHGNDRFAEPNVAVRTLPGGVARRRLCRANMPFAMYFARTATSSSPVVVIPREVLLCT